MREEGPGPQGPAVSLRRGPRKEGVRLPRIEGRWSLDLVLGEWGPPGIQKPISRKGRDNDGKKEALGLGKGGGSQRRKGWRLEAKEEIWAGR